MTKELLLIQSYSQLVDKLEADNRDLRAQLVKSKDNYTLMYNSRERYKTMHNGLLSKVQGFINTINTSIGTIRYE